MPEESELRQTPVPRQKQTFTGRLRRVGTYFRKNWWQLLLPSPPFLYQIFKWLLKGLGEDRIMGGLNRFIDEHAKWKWLKTLIFSLLDHPLLLLVFILSAILIHAYITTRTHDKTNIVLAHLALTKIKWDKNAGCYRKPELMPPELSEGLFANIAHFANESIVDEGKVKAQLTYTIEGNKYPASPAVWVDSQFNTVQFDVGDTRYLILNLGSHLHNEWHTVVNRRATADEPIATTGAFDLWPGEATIELHLLNERGGILRAYKLQWNWEWNRTPRISSVKHL